MGEQGGLFAAGAGADFEQDGGNRGFLFGEHGVGGGLEQLAALLVELGKFLAGQILQIPVGGGIVDDGLVVVDLLADALELLVGLDEAAQASLLLEQHGHPGGVAGHVGSAHLLAQLIITGCQLGKAVKEFGF